ncbi:MAG: MazG nucleotide pyrophosphohydrolase domain-containing protein [Acidimicrobiales bacterium]
MSARVVVVGLGPAGPDLVTDGTRAAIERVAHRYLRTARHPSAAVVADAVTFDHLYERSGSMEEVYAGIVEELCSAASTHGEVLYAVPGSPAVAERTVELLLIEDDLDVEVVPALSFLDLAWVRLGVDPVAVGARVVDGHRFAVEAAGERGPLLVAQCDRAAVLSDIKLAVDDPPELPVTVLARLGSPDESLTEVAWDDLDRLVEADHLTSLWIPELAAPVAGEVQRFDELVARLRVECPWDRDQTHRSLSRHLLEEAHEVLEVLDGFPPAAGTFGEAAAHDAEASLRYDQLEEELGDLLFQICFHTRLASEAGQFTLADVARRIHDKLVGRHPHVFGEVEAATADEVLGNWEQIKQTEKGRDSVFDGIPRSLPALSFAAKVESKAERLGLSEEAGAAGEPALGVDEVGELLYDLVARARRGGVDPEEALRLAADRRRSDYMADELAEGPAPAPGDLPG